MGKTVPASRTAYARGRAFEWRVRDHLQALGYLVVRSPQSRSSFDLIVAGRNVLYLIQCKVAGQLGPTEWNELYWLADSVNAIPVLATREKRKICLYQMVDTKDVRGKRAPKMLFAVGPNDRDMIVSERETIKENAHQLA